MNHLVVFGVGSTIGAIIDFVLALILLRAGYPGWLALALPMIVSGTAVYVFHQKVTFADLGSRQLDNRRLGLFLANTALVYVFRVAVYELLRRAMLSQVLALGAALVSSLILNFAISRLLIFSEKRSKR